MSDTDIQSMTDAELSKAIMREVWGWTPMSTKGWWLDPDENIRTAREATNPAVTVALLEWMTKHTYEVFVNRKDDGVYIVRVLMPKGHATVYTHADTLPRAVAEAALRVAREYTQQKERNDE